MSTEIVLWLISLCTSAIAGVVGFGGGMLLIAILPVFLNPALIIPIHGITQIASNSSRMVFSLSHVRWALFPKFFIGSLFGVLLFGYILLSVPTTYVPLAIGVYILLNLWSAHFADFIKRFESYYLIGFLQTGLGLVVGATGPLSLSVLTKELDSKDDIIATSSMFMTISHLAKIPVFAYVTAELFSNVELLLFMVAGAILGSFIGTKLRLAVPNEHIILAIKILLTLLAVRMIAVVVV
ncbi:sulfite exporter TauE/SafE family protein [Planctobacterium marinum]|uniref:sulfite exporter TauE/SafE family protein n=1 Tax=Planctobacterium marinum TaxID=1631968 RepID=UPI001E407483|nr:sulfite exporter TauE/SafE family protein [Planctobacterium marinum]MCC2605796.1 sulfite exporter TauE/SafE family protein [Planctobacterium marinum]